MLERVARSMDPARGREDTVERAHAMRDPAEHFLGLGQWRAGPPRRLWARTTTQHP